MMLAKILTDLSPREYKINLKSKAAGNRLAGRPGVVAVWDGPAWP
jgi:hypothetical protein